mmetsp:Transcript_10587/g.15855  ORF Transcript_10587/g.15855 Transcript_10587/m.15855 type:complete len:80 (+) Transcript_10587:2014-2253(+)
MGKGSLQISQSIDFQKKDTEFSVDLVDFLDSSQVFKQSKCMYFMLPEHEQGEIRGFSEVFSSHRQILQARPGSAASSTI